MLDQNNKRADQIILGVDPGLASTGYGVIAIHQGQSKMLDYGCISTAAQTAFELRLKEIHEQLQKIISEYNPQVLAIEELFFAKNAKTAMLVGQARGVILLTAMQNNLTIRQFTPLEVKQAVTGYGRADKKQMQQMVKILLKLKELPWPDDAADALAVAVCAGCYTMNKYVD